MNLPQTQYDLLNGLLEESINTKKSKEVEVKTKSKNSIKRIIT